MKIPVDERRVELEAIKARQKARKEAGTPQSPTNREIYQMLFDVLENQARIENKLNELEKR